MHNLPEEKMFEGQIFRLESLRNKTSPFQEAGCGAPEPSSSRYVTRAQTDCVVISKCIFCRSKKNESLRQVMSDPMNETNYDHHMFVRINFMPGLIASQVKYHSLCIVKAERSKKKVPMQMKECGKNVWKKYVHLARTIDVEISKSIETPLSTFRDELQKSIDKDWFLSFQPLNKKITGRQTLLIPWKFSAKVAADVALGNIDQNVPITRQVPIDDFRTLVHAALLLRGQLQDSPGQSGLHVFQGEAAAAMTKNLHLFLSALIGGDEVLNDVVDDQDENLSNLLKNVALYRPRYSLCGKRLTPKDIGLVLSADTIS
ncbi:hypothetical protein JTB14_009116 [Gonioctena quinquepunctata]|nr:hypothetical protein JTB14_009116 [Gonioctena quinquepunctata]